MTAARLAAHAARGGRRRGRRASGRSTPAQRDRCCRCRRGRAGRRRSRRGPPPPRAAPRRAGRRALGHDLRRDHDPGAAVPRPRCHRQCRDRRLRLSGIPGACSARPPRAGRSRRGSRGGRAAGVRVRFRPDRQPPRFPWRPGGGRAHVPARRSSDQPDRARLDRGGISGPTRDGRGPIRRQRDRGHRRRSRLDPVRPRRAPRSRATAPSQAIPTARRAARSRRHRAARPPPRRRIPDRRSRDRRHAADGGAAQHPRHARGPRRPRDPRARWPGRGHGDLLGGGCVRRREPDAVLAERSPGLHGRGAHGRREADRAPGGDIRTPFRRSLRAAHVRGRRSSRAPSSAGVLL